MPVQPDLTEFTGTPEERAIEELRRANISLQRQLDQAKHRGQDLIQAVYQAARDAAAAAPPLPPSPPKTRNTKDSEVAILHCSDWQVGKQTLSYNTEVAAQRVAALAAKVCRLTSIERADHPVNEIHLLLGGDMLENVAIFPGQAWEVDSTLFTQLFATVEMIIGLVARLNEDYPTIHVWEEAGNHGRLGRRGDYGPQDNADNIIYRICEQRLGKTVTWHRSTHGWHSIVQVGNYRALLVHGDEIKGFGGQTPAYGIVRKVNAWATGVVEPFTDCYMGHWHQPLVLPIAHGRGRVFVNPSIESDNVYAQEFVAASGTPGQRLNFVDPRKGRVTTERIVWLD